MDYKKVVKNRKTRIAILNMLSFVPDKTMLKLQYRIKTGRKLDLKNPRRYTEKLQWFKINYKDPLMIQCVDKYDVREYVKSMGLEETLNECYGVYEKVENIDFDELPDQFVLKDTLGGGGNSIIICKDKKTADFDLYRKTMQEWLDTKLIRSGGREWPYYSGKKPRIIIEELLIENNCHGLIDYKFICLNGRIACIFVLYDRILGNCAKMTTYNRDFENIHVSEKAELVGEGVDMPENFCKMVEIAEKLANKFPQVRVDLYNINGKVYFGELTFFDESGYTQYEPDEFDYELGSKFSLPSRWK